MIFLYGYFFHRGFPGQEGRTMGKVPEKRKKGDGPKRNNRFKCEEKKKCTKLKGRCKKNRKITDENCKNFVNKGCKNKPDAQCTCCLKNGNICIFFFFLAIH